DGFLRGRETLLGRVRFALALRRVDEIAAGFRQQGHRLHHGAVEELYGGRHSRPRQASLGTQRKGGGNGRLQTRLGWNRGKPLIKDLEGLSGVVNPPIPMLEIAHSTPTC